MAKNFQKKNIFLPPQKNDDQWCNGSTPGFGSVSLGSNPGWSTQYNSHYYFGGSFF